MSAVRKFLTGFFAGEIDPLLSARIDTDQYNYGLDTCENFIPLATGPLVKRPGYEWICDADDTSVWLSTFRFSITQEYLIEWGEELARFYTNGGRIETSPGVPYEVATPYAAADAPALSFQQSYDRLYIDHGSYAPAALSRTGATTFSWAVQVFENGPFKDQNTDEAITVTASGVTGSVTVTASSAIFAAGHVGALFQIEAKDFSTVKAWEAGMKAVAIGEKCRSDGKVYQAASAGTTGSNPPIHTDGSEWDGLGKDDINDKGPYGVQWTYLHDRFGMARITAVAGDGLSATVTVQRRFPDQVASIATFRWSHALFSAEEGWPSLVVHWVNRQVHIKGMVLAASVADDYGGGRVNFQRYTSSGMLAADLAFRRTLSAENPPLWVAADKKLLAGTADRELLIGPVNASAAISGDNISADPQSYYGSEAVRPLQIGTQTIFVERGGRRLRGAGFDISQDRYVPNDLTAASRHLTKSGIVQLAYQRLPFPMMTGVRDDGQLIVHCDTRLEIKGFGREVLGGGARVLSAQAIVGTDGKTDERWLLVERERADGTKREIWRQMPWRELGDPQDQSFFVDGGTQFTASGGQTDFTGFTHLAGSPIAVLAGGGVIPGITVDDTGAFSLPAKSVPSSDYTLTVGLAYTATAITLRPNVETKSGSSQGVRQRVRKLVLRVLETLGISIGSHDGELENVIERPASAAMDAPIPLLTGDTDGQVPGEFSRDGRVRFISADPLPAIINGVAMSIELDGADV